MSGCGSPGCRQNLKETMDTREIWGCGAEWLEGQACTLRNPSPCGGSSTFCSDAFASHRKCIDDAYICVRGNTPGGGCVIGCEGGWSTECKPNGGALTCACSTGRNSGLTFLVSAPCHSDEWQNAVRMNCQ